MLAGAWPAGAAAVFVSFTVAFTEASMKSKTKCPQDLRTKKFHNDNGSQYREGHGPHNPTGHSSHL